MDSDDEVSVVRMNAAKSMMRPFLSLFLECDAKSVTGSRG
jgi:hypothetical protein